MRRLIRLTAGLAGSLMFISLLVAEAEFKSHGQGQLPPHYVPAQTVRVVDHTMTEGPIPNNCVTPVAKFNFAPGDVRAFQWVRLANVRTGDVIRWDFLRPSGVLHATFPAPLSASSDLCIWAFINIAGQQAASLSGAWQVRVFYNNVRIVTDYFTISGASLVTSVSAASYQPASAPEAIVAAFGSALAAATASATTLPLPTVLAGVTVKVRDNEGDERAAPLFFVAPAQINYQVPPGTKPGAATVTIERGGNVVATGVLDVSAVAPSLFTANANGQGIAAAVALRIGEGGEEVYETVAVFDASQNRFVAQPIDLGPETEQVFLLLFGTGFRQRSALSAATCRIGGGDAEVLYAGPQSDFVGLDQANVRLPRSLAGRGEVEVACSIDGKAANAVRVQIK